MGPFGNRKSHNKVKKIIQARLAAHSERGDAQSESKQKLPRRSFVHTSAQARAKHKRNEDRTARDEDRKARRTERIAARDARRAKKRA